MKSFKILLMVALTISTLSLFAQVQSTGKANKPCIMPSGLTAKNTGVLNLSLKEKMKAEIMKIPVAAGSEIVIPNTIPAFSFISNFSSKERSKAEIMKIAFPVNTYATTTRYNRCPICNMELKDMVIDCCMGAGKTADKISCPVFNKPSLNLSPKEKMKIGMIKI